MLSSLASLLLIGAIECQTSITDIHVVQGLKCPENEVAVGVHKLSLSNPQLSCGKVKVECTDPSEPPEENCETHIL